MSSGSQTSRPSSALVWRTRTHRRHTHTMKLQDPHPKCHRPRSLQQFPPLCNSSKYDLVQHVELVDPTNVSVHHRDLQQCSPRETSLHVIQISQLHLSTLLEEQRRRLLLGNQQVRHNKLCRHADCRQLLRCTLCLKNGSALRVYDETECRQFGIPHRPECPVEPVFLLAVSCRHWLSGAGLESNLFAPFEGQFKQSQCMPRRRCIEDDDVESWHVRQVDETLECSHLFGAGRCQLLRHRSNSVFAELGPRVVKNSLLVVFSCLLLIDLGRRQP